jgi:hypothetical protein
MRDRHIPLLPPKTIIDGPDLVMCITAAMALPAIPLHRNANERHRQQGVLHVTHRAGHVHQQHDNLEWAKGHGRQLFHRRGIAVVVSIVVAIVIVDISSTTEQDPGRPWSLVHDFEHRSLTPVADHQILRMTVPIVLVIEALLLCPLFLPLHLLVLLLMRQYSYQFDIRQVDVTESRFCILEAQPKLDVTSIVMVG